jgi:transposase
VGCLKDNTILFFCDEMRYGLISNYRRSWSPVGIRTIIDNQQQFSNRYLFSAVAPLSGESFHLMGFEENTSYAVSIFFNELEKNYPDKNIVVVFDHAPSHRPKIVRERERVTCIFLPPYSPELNPAERFFEEVRKSTANQIFKTIDEQEEAIALFVKTLSLDREKMKQLLGYEWIQNQWEEVS